MNPLIWIVAIAVVAIFYWKVSAAVLLGALQYHSRTLISALRLNIIPLINFDYELTNLILIFSLLALGLPFALLAMLSAIAAHFMHEEIVSIGGIADFVARSSVLLLVAGTLSLPLSALIPAAIVSSKVFAAVFGRLVFGARLLSVKNIKEAFASAVYLWAFGVY